jgi:predicted ATPase
MEAAVHPLRRAKRELLAHSLCQEIALEHLSKAEVAEYLSGESRENLPQGFAEFIYQRSEGNPLFMIAALNHMTEHGSIAREGGSWRLKVRLQEIELEVPETLREMIEAQISHLTTEEQRVLEAASVAGVMFAANAVTAALQQDSEFVEEILAKLSRRSRILRAAGSLQMKDGGISQAFEFVHALYHQVLYERLTPVRRDCIRRALVCRSLHEVAESAAQQPEGSGPGEPALRVGAAAVAFA